MTKIHLMTTSNKNTIIADETKTIREIFENNGVNYSVGTVSINGECISNSELDKALRTFIAGDECWLSVIVKASNAASANVHGAACIVTSAIKLEDLLTVQKYRPNALTLVDENKEPYFMVNVDMNSVCGDVSKFGVTFSKNANIEGYATVTLLLNTQEEDMTSFVEDKIGNALLNLNKLEESIGAVMAEINEEKQKIRACITIE